MLPRGTASDTSATALTRLRGALDHGRRTPGVNDLETCSTTRGCARSVAAAGGAGERVVRGIAGPPGSVRAVDVGASGRAGPAGSEDLASAAAGGAGGDAGPRRSPPR